MSIAKQSLAMTGLYEAELLTELMLRFWEHPLANEEEFRSDLLESAAEALQQAAKGAVLISEIPARKMNLVAALWFAELNLMNAMTENDGRAPARLAWLTNVRRALPSCFCDPDLLQ